MESGGCSGGATADGVMCHIEQENVTQCCNECHYIVENVMQFRNKCPSVVQNVMQCPVRWSK